MSTEITFDDIKHKVQRILEDQDSFLFIIFGKFPVYLCYTRKEIERLGYTSSNSDNRIIYQKNSIKGGGYYSDSDSDSDSNFEKECNICEGKDFDAKECCMVCKVSNYVKKRKKTKEQILTDQSLEEMLESERQDDDRVKRGLKQEEEEDRPDNEEHKKEASKVEKIMEYESLKDKREYQRLERERRESIKLPSGISVPFRMTIPPISKSTEFVGLPFEELTGMFYLIDKYPNNCIPIPKILNKEEILEKNLQWTDFSLIWDEKAEKIVVPKHYWKAIINCLKKEPIPPFIILSFGYTCKSDIGHSNFLIYDTKSKEMERFEPYGSIAQYGSRSQAFTNCVQVPDLDEKIKSLFNSNIKDMIKHMYSPVSYSFCKSFQSIQEKEGQIKSTDPKGFCVAWSIWYADVRMSNPQLQREQVVEMAHEKLRSSDLSFTTFIRSYAEFISKLSKDFKSAGSFPVIEKARIPFEDYDPEVWEPIEYLNRVVSSVSSRTSIDSSRIIDEMIMNQIRKDEEEKIRKDKEEKSMQCITDSVGQPLFLLLGK